MEAIPVSKEEVSILLRLNGITPTEDTIAGVTSNVELLVSHYQNLGNFPLGPDDEPAFLFLP